jgi:hypothetical protein
LTRSGSMRLGLALLVLGVSGFLVATVSVSHAQVTTTTDQTSSVVSTTSTSPATTGTTTTGGEASEEENEDIAMLVLLFGFLLATGVFIYTGVAQTKYYDLAEKALKRTGVLPQSEFPSAFPAERVAGGRMGAAESPVKLEGPAVAVVGQKAEFTATRDADPVDVTWTVDPSSAAEVDPSSPASKVLITPTKKGTFKVRAAIDGSTWETGVTAIDPSAQRSSLPFVGLGYGAVLIAIVILTLATVLALLGKFSSDAIATLFGALAGYVFFRVGTSGEGSSGSSSASGGDSS